MRVKYLKVKYGERLNIGRFPNFSANGNVKGMKEKYYGKDALLVQCGSYIYHVGNLNRNKSMIMSYGENIYFNCAH